MAQAPDFHAQFLNRAAERKGDLREETSGSPSLVLGLAASGSLGNLLDGLSQVPSQIDWIRNSGVGSSKFCFKTLSR